MKVRSINDKALTLPAAGRAVTVVVAAGHPRRVSLQASGTLGITKVADAAICSSNSERVCVALTNVRSINDKALTLQVAGNAVTIAVADGHAAVVADGHAAGIGKQVARWGSPTWQMLRSAFKAR